MMINHQKTKTISTSQQALVNKDTSMCTQSADKIIQTIKTSNKK